LKTDSLFRRSASSALCLVVVLSFGAGTAAATQQSLIDPATFRGPAADQRAYRVGDVLTVVVLEATTALSQAGTASDKSTGVTASMTSLRNKTYDANFAIDGKRNGTAQTTRVGQLSAQITVRVTGVEASGLLRISGRQSMVINGESQSIILSGLVRAEDISATNTVMSNQIADADVSVSGTGVVSEAQKRGLISRVMGWLGLQ
jgi:flagellar L-ring protein precursor FlgH